MVRNFFLSLLAVAAVAIAFFAGRASVPDPDRAHQLPTQASVASDPMPRLVPSDAPKPGDAHSALLRALELPAAERKQAIRRAMNAWLAEDGTAALSTARADPRLAEVVELMTRVALIIYPELFTEDPSLLDGVAGADGLIASSTKAISPRSGDPAQRTLLELRMGTAMGTEAESLSGGDLPFDPDNAYAEIQSILAEPNLMNRWTRLHGLLYMMAESDPAAAAAVVDDLPTSFKQRAASALIALWAQSDPSSAAHWLGSQGERTTRQVFPQLALQWGMQDFPSASAFADTLPGTERRAFLQGLAEATHNLPHSEKLAWIARFEGEPNYSALVVRVAPDIAEEDTAAALSLVESLPQADRLNGFLSILPMMAVQDPDATLAAIQGIGDPSSHDQLVAMVAPIWVQTDPDRALNVVLDLEPGATRDQALASLAFGFAQVDSQRAFEAIEQIENPAYRRAPLQGLLGFLEDENAAIRFGREHGFDREAVLKVRANSPAGLSGSFMPMPVMIAPGGAAAGFGPSSFTAALAAPPMVMLEDGRGSFGATDSQPDEDR